MSDRQLAVEIHRLYSKKKYTIRDPFTNQNLSIQYTIEDVVNGKVRTSKGFYDCSIYIYRTRTDDPTANPDPTYTKAEAFGFLSSRSGPNTSILQLLTSTGGFKNLTAATAIKVFRAQVLRGAYY